MTREEQIKEASIHYDDTFCTGGIQDAFEAGAEWADKTMLEEVLYWLEDVTIDDADGWGHPIVSFIGFDNKEQMLQSFKEQFNID